MKLKLTSTRKLFLNLYTPLIVEQIFAVLIGNINVLLLSYYNDQAVASTSIANQVLSIGTMAMGIVSLGSTILFLQNADKSQLNYVKGVARQALILNITLGITIFILVLSFGRLLMNLMQTPEVLIHMSTLYLQIVSGSLIFQGISSSISSLLRSFGKVKQAMLVSIINTLVTISGNAIVILAPIDILGGGILGISIATVLSRLIGAFISTWAIYKFLPSIWNGLFNFNRKEFPIIKRILSLGIPSGMENVSYNFSQTILTAVIASFGAASVSAKIYTQTATAIVFTISATAGLAMQIIISQFLRDKQFNRVKLFTFRTTTLFVGISMIINIGIALLGTYVANIFTADPLIISLMTILLWLNVIYDPLRGANEILISSLLVSGDVRYPVIIGVTVTYAFTVPFSIFIGSFLEYGIIAVWLIFILDEGIRVLIFARRIKTNAALNRFF